MFTLYIINCVRVFTVKTLKFKAYDKLFIILTRIMLLNTVCINYMRSMTLKNDIFKFLITKTFNNSVNTVVLFTAIIYFILVQSLFLDSVNMFNLSELYYNKKNLLIISF